MFKRFIASVFNPSTTSTEEQLESIRNKYGIVPRETLEEAELASKTAFQQLKAIIELSALIDRMSMKIKIADKKGDLLESFKLRQLLKKRIAEAKREGLL